MTALLAGDLARAGVNIVSGLALGIDAAAHREAVRVARSRQGGVRAVAVLGCGAAVVHPRSNRSLFAQVHDGGAILAEYGWELPPVAWRFPARNRIIAGLADAVVVVEGRANSGSLHTAAFMLDLGREVLAVPGEAGRRLSAGPHKLLREGARLCESAADVLEAIGLSGDLVVGAGLTTGQSGEADLASTERRVLERLRTGVHTPDQLAAGLRESAATVVAALSLLEVEGLIAPAAGGRYRAVATRPRMQADVPPGRHGKEPLPAPANNKPQGGR